MPGRKVEVRKTYLRRPESRLSYRGHIREIYSLTFFNEKQAPIDIMAMLADGSSGNRAAQ
jgi:hypothetical protein